MEEENKSKEVVIEKTTPEVSLSEDNDSEEDEEEIRTRVMQIWYTASQAEKLNKFFRECGIKFKFIK